MQQVLSRDEFTQALRAKGACYHIHHPFHILLYEGRASREQMQAWVANRFYYQACIPRKDAAILANCPHSEVRRKWLQRLLDQDGGGLEAWLQLAEAVGLARAEVLSEAWVLPGVRFAVDAYLNFARRACWQEAAGSSLTELFAPQIHQQRLASWPQHYPWIQPQGYAYFQKRLSEAERDVSHGLQLALDYCTSAQRQQRMLNILQFKLDVLWSLLDALSLAYELGRPPYYNISRQRLWHRGIDA